MHGWQRWKDTEYQSVHMWIPVLQSSSLEPIVCHKNTLSNHLVWWMLHPPPSMAALYLSEQQQQTEKCPAFVDSVSFDKASQQWLMFQVCLAEHLPQEVDCIAVVAPVPWQPPKGLNVPSIGVARHPLAHVVVDSHEVPAQQLSSKIEFPTICAREREQGMDVRK